MGYSDSEVLQPGAELCSSNRNFPLLLHNLHHRHQTIRFHLRGHEVSHRFDLRNEIVEHIKQCRALGFCYTLCYSAVVTKTNRISRIFSAHCGGQPSYTSPAASVLISLLLTMVEVGVCVAWLVAEPASTKHIFQQKTRILVCSG